MPDSLTTVEQNVYHYLLDFLTKHTYQPSVREIGRRFHIKSTKTVSELLQSLERKGYIERDPSRSRGVRLIGYEGARRTQLVPSARRRSGQDRSRERRTARRRRPRHAER